jgi:diaminohydroxyphosphoribosylaminopyrimidine deaminase/5-amino-6-(5-phosphoribosylamino)uracil reductase
LLLEGGPTLAAAFLAEDLIDQVMVFVAPKLAGDGPGLVAALPKPVDLLRLSAREVGVDILLEAFVHEP